MTGELAARVRYSQQSSLSDFVSQINSLRDEDSMKRLTIKSVEQKLMEDGNFEEYYVNGIPRKRLTDKGRECTLYVHRIISDKLIDKIKVLSLFPIQFHNSAVCYFHRRLWIIRTCHCHKSHFRPFIDISVKIYRALIQCLNSF